VHDTRKFDRGLSRLVHTELHWLDVPERVQYKLVVLMYHVLMYQAPRYLTDHCTPISDTVFRQHLRSASSHQVSVPRYRLSTYGRRAFSVVAGPTVWNSLPEDMRDPECSVDSYRQSMKTFLPMPSIDSGCLTPLYIRCSISLVHSFVKESLRKIYGEFASCSWL